jgi:hypothetical protein
MRLFGVVAGLLVVVALAVAAADGAFGGASYPPQGAPPPPNPAELQKLGQIALEAATGAGDPHPTAAVVVPSTRRIAEDVDAGAGINSNLPVYFLLLHGHFTVDGPIPRGAKPPTGSIYTLTINSRTNQGMDVGVGDLMPDLYAIGEPEPLPLPTAVG